SGILDRIIFDDETADSYEIGLKGETLNRRLRFEAAAFYSEYDDLQVSIFDGVAALLVGNAASATSSGLEFQSQFAATDQLTLGVSSTFLNSEYDSYEAGPCSCGQGTVCDLSGKTLPYAPEFSGALNASWADTLSSGWGYELQGKVFHTTEFSTAGDLDPAVAQDAFSKVDASLTFTSPNDTWTLALVGKNLTDETTAHFGDDIPLSNLLGNNYQQYVDPPRTLAFQVKYRFQ
ncbi:MAG: TonB-dependent receptor, partial [Henriciella sp.]|uniref:TonB-dependent receptor domain-containing protein n=1 Tax=Henriciella sp. TaxID=1968823 RepID=UPI003C75B647